MKSEFHPMPEEERKSFFICGACGELVDGRDREAIKLHHEHMRHPWKFSFKSNRQSAARGRARLPNDERKKANASGG